MTINLENSKHIAGLDEAGRGPLAGDVYAAAVVLDPKNPIKGLKDSKLLSSKAREKLAIMIKNDAIAWSVASASAAEIDAMNILQASLLAMQRAFAGLALHANVKVDLALIDGLQCPKLSCETKAVVRGDTFIQAISAASILAKVARDAAMYELHTQFPLYGFDTHKGYPTKAHLEALRVHGPCPFHRFSFAPVRRVVS